MSAELKFECQKCGCCCNRILINSIGITVGLALLPGEEDLFKSYPDAVKPYMGLRRMQGKGKIVDLLCYQMVQEPCPLYDRIMKRCTRYEDRPMSCREYPFTHDSYFCIELYCTWVKQHDIKFGETPVRMAPEQQSAMIRMNSFFLSIHDQMQKKRSTLMMFDVATNEWAILKDDREIQ